MALSKDWSYGFWGNSAIEYIDPAVLVYDSDKLLKDENLKHLLLDETVNQTKKMFSKTRIIATILDRLNFTIVKQGYCQGPSSISLSARHGPQPVFMEQSFLNLTGVSGVFIVAARRTAFGTYGGKLKDKTATDLAEIAARGALEAGNVKPEQVSSIVFGNVIQASQDAAYLARHAGLRAGCPVEIPALTVNRLCGSGFQAIVNGAQEIMLGESEVVLCGGTESMSGAPYAVRDIRFGTKFGQPYQFEDTLWSGLTDNYVKLPMAITAENLAEKYGITRQNCDDYALQTQTRWKQANQDGRFKEEIIPITLKGKKGPQTFDTDEHPRDTSKEILAKLAPVFKKDGTVTAGNASGVCDGAAALVLASEDAVKKYNYTPLARLVSYATAGCDPKIMGIGPVPSSLGALKAAGKEMKDMELVEVNEAFAAQYLSVEKQLGLNPEITNVNGGGIALGHPLAASGARITGHLVHELRRRKMKLALGSACIGGGQGMAVIIENVQ